MRPFKKTLTFSHCIQYKIPGKQCLWHNLRCALYLARGGLPIRLLRLQPKARDFGGPGHLRPQLLERLGLSTDLMFRGAQSPETLSPREDGARSSTKPKARDDVNPPLYLATGTISFAAQLKVRVVKK